MRCPGESRGVLLCGVLTHARSVITDIKPPNLTGQDMTGTQHTAEQVKQVLDVGAATGTAAALIGWVPSVTAVFTLIYVIVRLYETDTVQRVLKRGKDTQALPPIDPADTSDTD